MVLDSGLQVLASSSDQINRVSSRIPTLLEIEQANLKQSWTSLDSSPGGSYLIRVLVPVLSFSSNEKPLYLQAFFSVDPKLSMMADSVEAASRSLKKYDNESISGLVNGIIDSQVSQHQFVNTNITFNDVTSIKKMFIKKLMNIYHVRIEYPK